MRRFVSSLLTVLPLIFAAPRLSAAGAPPAPPSPWAFGVQAAALLDRQSGRLLWQASAYNRRAPASTTKLLTALVAVQRGDLARIIEVSRGAASVSGSSAHIGPGERYRLRELLEGMLLRSGNDAAHAIAESLGGSVPRYMEWENETAIRLGARQTHFVNPHGLTQRHHYTSAQDLALIARAALAQPEIARIVQSQELVLEEEGGHRRPIRNTNQLLGGYLGADGAKTGTTNAAGRCLVASATRGGVRLIATVLHGGDRYGMARALLDYGFSRYGAGLSIAAGAPFGHLRDGRAIWLGHAVSAARPVGEPLRLQVRLDPQPGAQGGVVGMAVVLRAGVPVAAAPLLAGPRPLPWYLVLLRWPHTVDPPSPESL